MNGEENVTFQGHKWMEIVTGALIAASILVMYMTHRAIPFMMDDLWYSTMLSDDTPIASFSDIVRSQIWHYYNWGGRSMTHAILQLVLLAGEQVADVLNVVFTLLLAGMICVVSGHRRLPAFFAAMGMLLGLNANWRMSMFWQAGAANYLYITVFILVFAHCYLREWPEEGRIALWQKHRGNGQAGGIKGQMADVKMPTPSSLPGITLWMIPLGILTGWSNENMGPVMWVLSFITIVFLLKRKRKIKLWMILGSISCLVGSVMCIAAPGNFVRSSQIKEEQYGIVWRIFLRSYAECKAALEYLFPTLLILGFVWVICCGVLKQALGIRNILLLFCALLSWEAMFLSPHYPDRAAFGTMTLCICVIVSIAKKILQQRSDLVWFLWSGAALIWLRGMYFCGEYLAVVWGWIK